MAIQNRRGAFTNFNPSNMLPGEWAIVVSGDTNTTDGKAVYIAFAAGDVKRMATIDDMDADIEVLFEEAMDSIQDAIDARQAPVTLSNEGYIEFS